MKKRSISLLGILSIVFALSSSFVPTFKTFTDPDYMLFGNVQHTSSPSAWDIFGQGLELGEAYFEPNSQQVYVIDMSDEDVQSTYCYTPLYPVCAAILRIRHNGCITTPLILKIWYGTFTQ